MIRTKAPDARLFYSDDEIYVPPSTNFYARLNVAVGGWAKLAEPLRSAFSAKVDGRPSDHTVYVKIFLIGYLENIVWDTDLAERIADSLAIRQFLGYGPTEKTPDHSSISRTRNRFGDGQLEQVLDTVVELCGKKNLIDAECVCVDSTLNAANASLSSLQNVKTGKSVSEHLNEARKANEKLKVDNETFRSTTDSDARITKKGSSRRAMYYKTTHVTDSKSQVILSARTDTADTCEVAAAIEPLQQAKRRLESMDKKLGTTVCDAGYDDAGFHKEIESLGATPLTNYQAHKSNKAEEVQKDKFRYDAERDLYICPNGAELTMRYGHVPKGSATGSTFLVYLAKATDCAGCPLRSACLAEGSDHRSISRHEAQGSRQRNIERCHTEEGRAKLKQRKVVVEPPFGHMKRYGGLAQVNCRTLRRVRVKLLMAAIAWNLMKLVKVTPVPVLSALKSLLLSPFFKLPWSGMAIKSRNTWSCPIWPFREGFCDSLYRTYTGNRKALRYSPIFGERAVRGCAPAHPGTKLSYSGFVRGDASRAEPSSPVAFRFCDNL